MPNPFYIHQLNLQHKLFPLLPIDNDATIALSYIQLQRPISGVDSFRTP